MEKIWSDLFTYFFFISGIECPPLRRQMVSRSKGLATWMSNAPCCSCSTIRYMYTHTPFAQLSCWKKLYACVVWLSKNIFPPSQPPQYKLDPRLARLLGVHTQTRASIMQALWLYIKNNKLQDSHEKEYINCNRYFRQVWYLLKSVFIYWLEMYSWYICNILWFLMFFLLVERQSDATVCPWHIKHVLLSNHMLNRSLAVLAWGSLRFPWNWLGCFSTLTPSLSITWLGKGCMDHYASFCVCACVMCVCVVPACWSVLSKILKKIQVFALELWFSSMRL